MNPGRDSAPLVLLVDDDDSVRKIAAQSLAKLGFRVLQACDGHSALETIELHGQEIELVVSDVRMPGLQGDELARIVLRRLPHICVLLTSGHARTGDFQYGDTNIEVLPKPYSLLQLANAVAKVMGECRHDGTGSQLGKSLEHLRAAKAGRRRGAALRLWTTVPITNHFRRV